MKRLGKLGSVAIAAAVVAIVGLIGTQLRSHGDRDPSRPAPRTAAAVPTTATEPVAPVVDGDQVPELEGRAPQRDVDPGTASVRSYRRSHRLLEQLPQTYRGVTFDSAGRTPDGRVRLTANPNGLTASDALRIYRRLLRRARDPGRAYALEVLTPSGSAP